MAILCNGRKVSYVKPSLVTAEVLCRLQSDPPRLRIFLTSHTLRLDVIGTLAECVWRIFVTELVRRMPFCGMARFSSSKRQGLSSTYFLGVVSQHLESVLNPIF